MAGLFKVMVGFWKREIRVRKQGMWLAVTVIALSVGCNKEPDANPAETSPAPAPVTQAPTAPATLDLSDVIETNPRYVVGISYPPGAANYPGLARELVTYADAAKAELLQAVAALGNDKPSSPYELSLNFEITASSPDVVAASADGSRYTGGAHGEPLVARFVWLQGRDERLTVVELLPSEEGLKAVSQYAAQQLQQQANEKAQAERLSPEEAESTLRSASKMIAIGTAPSAENFDQFLPVLEGGKIAAIRFVFPPYQVGPYSDGTQSVEVPAAQILRYVSPEYVGLFIGY
jgi:hypothetical protein